jgi:hypothetical protein
MPHDAESLSESEQAPERERRRSAEAFLTDFFRTEKCRVRRLDPSVIEVTLNPDLALEFQKEKLILAFARKATERFPEADLAIAGSRPYDQVIQLARRRGPFSVQYARREHAWRGFDALAEPVTFVGFEPEVRVEEAQDHAILVFNFGVSFRSVAVSDEMVSLGYDAYFENVTADVDGYLSRWLDFSAKKLGDLRRVEPPPIAEVFPVVCRALDQKIRRKVQRIKRQSRRLLQQEIQKVEGYYRQLIAEERQNRERRERLSPRGNADAADRIEIYQLDWKRRIAEETKHYEPSVVLRLISLGKLYVPRTPLTLAVPGAEPHTKKRLAFNHATGALEGLVCDLCDAPMVEVFPGEDGRLLCRGCAEEGPTDGEEDAGESPSRRESDEDRRD